MGTIDLGSLLSPTGSSDAKGEDSPNKVKKISEAIDIFGTASAPSTPTPSTPTTAEPLPVNNGRLGL